MLKGFAIEEPLDFELGVVLGFNGGFKVQGLSFALVELRIKGDGPDWCRELSFGRRSLSLVLSSNRILYLLYLF